MKKSLYLLLELIQLQKSNTHLFNEKLYEALMGDFRDLITSKVFNSEETKLVIKYLIKYFESKEEYEKCQQLQIIIDKINNNS